MPRRRKLETDADRRERLAETAVDRRKSEAAAESAIDDMVRKSIKLHGA